MELRAVLLAEFAERRRRNLRYSLRAYARFLGTDHATLSQILRRRRSLSPRMAQRLGRRLGLGPAQIAEARQHQIAEAVLRLVRTGSARPDSRWIAARTGQPLDAVNTALHRLLHRGELVMASAGRWVAA